MTKVGSRIGGHGCKLQYHSRRTLFCTRAHMVSTLITRTRDVEVVPARFHVRAHAGGRYRLRYRVLEPYVWYRSDRTCSPTSAAHATTIDTAYTHSTHGIRIATACSLHLEAWYRITYHVHKTSTRNRYDTISTRKLRTRYHTRSMGRHHQWGGGAQRGNLFTNSIGIGNFGEFSTNQQISGGRPQSRIENIYSHTREAVRSRAVLPERTLDSHLRAADTVLSLLAPLVVAAWSGTIPEERRPRWRPPQPGPQARPW